MSARARGRDRGTTLVELIIAVTLLGIVSGAIAGALYFGIQTTNKSGTRLDQSMSEMAVTRYLTGDIMSAEGPLRINGADSRCGAATLILYSRSDAVLAAPDTAVMWTLSGGEILRQTCTTATGAKSTVRTVAREISAFDPTCGTATSPCTAASVSVGFTAAAANGVPSESWSLTVTRRGVTS